MLMIEEFVFDYVNGFVYSLILGKVCFNDFLFFKYVNFVVIVLLGNMVVCNFNIFFVLWDLRVVCIEREW